MIGGPAPGRGSGNGFLGSGHAGGVTASGGVVGGGPYRAPEDTGEAYDRDASDLTITIGYGP